MVEENFEIAISNIIAKGKIGKPIDLLEVAKLIDEAIFNEGFRGGRIEIEILEEGQRIGMILLYNSGSYMITGCKSVADLELANELFQELITNI